MKNVLMIAYHFPPVRVSSGIQRTLKFSQYLLKHGWKAQVLTVNLKAYLHVDDGQIKEIPKDVTVKRAFALDTARHLAIKGRYLSWLALPDRWVSWCIGGVISGLTLVVNYKPSVIWSTYPIATAHLIGLILHRLTRIPWIADFRDSMTEDDYPVDPRQKRIYQWIERQTIKHCTRAVFTTPGAIKLYATRYPDIPENRWALISNGYDEENFAMAEKSQFYQVASKNKENDQIVLLHSGILYPSERDPSQFFLALAEMLKNAVFRVGEIKIILRATGHDSIHSQLINQNGLQEVVFLEPGVAYEEALVEMLVVDGLLIFQAANCNHQIPAKIYEYLRAKRPIFALTDPTGNTAEVLIQANIPNIAPLDDKDAIIKGLSAFLEAIKTSKASIANNACIEEHSREAKTRQLAKLLDECVTVADNC
ncbi:MAG: glycosyltransferase [Methylococcales bacterium]